MKEGHMEKKKLILWVSMMCLVLGMGVFAWAEQKQPAKTVPAKILPISVEVTSVERLNAIAAKPPFQATDVLVFRVNFKLSNPNKALAKVDDLYFEAKVEDGTLDKTIVIAESMPSGVIPAGGEMIWSATAPFLYGGVRASFMLRGVGGEEGVKGASQKMEELWQNLGADKMQFFVEGNITFSLPNFPKLGMVREQFKTEFTIPKL
jgi:hypothetical protein